MSYKSLAKLQLVVSLVLINIFNIYSQADEGACEPELENFLREGLEKWRGLGPTGVLQLAKLVEIMYGN